MKMGLELKLFPTPVFERLSHHLLSGTKKVQSLVNRIGSKAEAKVISPNQNLSLDQTSLLDNSLDIIRSEQVIRGASKHNALEAGDRLFGKAWHEGWESGDSKKAIAFIENTGVYSPLRALARFF